MWRFKYLLIGMAFPALLGVAIYLTAPRIADAFRDAVRDSAQNAVQDTFRDQVPATVEPGQIVITERQLFAAMQDADDNENNFDASGYDIEIANGEVRITDDDRDRTSDNFVIASVVPQIEDGRLVLTDRGGFLSIFKSARDAIADEIEVQAEADLHEQWGAAGQRDGGERAPGDRHRAARQQRRNAGADRSGQRHGPNTNGDPRFLWRADQPNANPHAVNLSPWPEDDGRDLNSADACITVPTPVARGSRRRPDLLLARSPSVCSLQTIAGAPSSLSSASTKKYSPHITLSSTPRSSRSWYEPCLRMPSQPGVSSARNSGSSRLVMI